MSRFNVAGFPTILVFGADKDRPSKYEGARSASAIESFALEQLEVNLAPPEVTELTSQVSFSKIIYCNSHLAIYTIILPFSFFGKYQYLKCQVSKSYTVAF